MANKTEWTISVKKGDKCSLCKGSGVVPLLNDNMSVVGEYEGYTLEIACKRCKGKGKIIKRVDLSLESLKDLLK